jgi:hypothetical protein
MGGHGTKLEEAELDGNGGSSTWRQGLEAMKRKKSGEGMNAGGGQAAAAG